MMLRRSGYCLGPAALSERATFAQYSWSTAAMTAHRVRSVRAAEVEVSSAKAAVAEEEGAAAVPAAKLAEVLPERNTAAEPGRPQAVPGPARS
jgi:hypothetical protein